VLDSLGIAANTALSTEHPRQKNEAWQRTQALYNDFVRIQFLLEGLEVKSNNSAENLDYNASGSKCGNNGVDNEGGDWLSEANSEICDTYGRLYNWSTAMSACPSGWHLPSDADWNVLMKFINASCLDNSNCAIAGAELKATKRWEEAYNNTDRFGFSALPGGTADFDGNFIGNGIMGFWWSASEESASSACARVMTYFDDIVLYLCDDKSNFLSVRCLQD